MNKPIELTNDMTQQERIAAQNVNNTATLDEITNHKSIMTVSTQEKYATLPNAAGTLSFDKVLSSVGTSLSNSNGGIRIGAGINKVKVSCNLWIRPLDPKNRMWCTLRLKSKNGIEKRIIGSIIGMDPSGFITESISPVLVDVDEGDYFVITYLNDVAGMVVNGFSDARDITNLTVEVVN